MAEVAGSLGPTWESWSELLLPGFGLAQDWLLQAFRAHNRRWESSVPVHVCLSDKIKIKIQINKL